MGAIYAEIFEIYNVRYVRFNGAACDDTKICTCGYLGAFPTSLLSSSLLSA